MTNKIWFFILIVSLVLVTDASARRQDKLQAPWTKKAKIHPLTPPQQNASTPGIVFDFYVHLFQKYISPVDGDRCQMSPSCSQFCRRCLKKHGGLLGFIMCADRLMRDNSSAHRHYPSLIKKDRLYYYDPITANDFWFSP